MYFTNLAHDGMSMSPDEVLTLEKKLSIESNNLEYRAKLLGYYWLHQTNIKSLIPKHQEQLFWILDNIPESPIAGIVPMTLNLKAKPEIYKKAKDIWLKEVSDTNKISLLSNAANFFRLQDTEIAIKLLKKLKSIEPDNPHWPDYIGQFYISMIHQHKNKQKQKVLAKEALIYEKEAFEMFPTEEEKFYKLSSLADLSRRAVWGWVL